jgi:predicted lipoprotein with Yx(FWY)xxD motif
MNRMATMPVAACAVSAVLLAAGCGGSSGAAGGLYGGEPSSKAPSAPAAAAATLGVGTTGIGQVVVNSAGRTLYLFEKDRNGRSACSGACVGFWPPLISKGDPMTLRGLNQALVGTTTRSDGTKQVTYAGHPVYMFVQDTKPGQTNGEGLTDFGGSWDALSPAGAKIEAGQSGSSQSGGW